MPNYGANALKNATKINLQSTGDYNPVIEIARESGLAVQKFLMEILNIK